MRRAAFALVLVACGGAAKAPPATSPASAAAGATSTGDADSGKEARAARATGPAPGVDSFVVLPRPSRSLVRLRALLKNAPAATPMLDRLAAYARSLDFEQPVYAVVLGDSSATSMGLTAEGAKTARENAANDCAVFDVAGSARIVCPRGPKGGSLKALAAAVPPASASDGHFELSAEGLAELAVKGGSASSTLERFALGTEVRSITGDLTLEGAAELRVAIGLAGKGHYAAGVLAAPVAAPPSTFARLPADAELAVFLHAPPATAEGVYRKEVLDALVDNDAQCTDAEKSEARARFEKVIFTGGSLALAAGFDRAAAEAAAEALVKAPADKRKQGALRAAAAAWIVVGVEEPSARWLDNVTWLAKSHCAKDKKPSKVTVVTKLPARLGLPAGSVEIIERKTLSGAAPATAPAPLSFTFVVPDRSGGPERTWIALGEDEAVVAARVRASAQGAPDATLTKRPGLATLREPATFGGFVTPAGIAWLLADTKDTTNATSLGPVEAAFLRSRSLATGGRTPILFRGEMAKDKSSGDGLLTTRITIDGGAIGDLVSVVGSSLGLPE